MTPCYCILLRQAARRLTARYDAALAPFGITVAQYSVLSTISARSPVSLSDLAASQAIDRSTMGRNARVLARHGFVTFTGGEDQRETLLDLTDAGRAKLEETRPAWRALQTEIGEDMGADDMRKLQDLLARI